MKQELFGMRRANGDWFVLDVAGEWLSFAASRKRGERERRTIN